MRLWLALTIFGLSNMAHATQSVGYDMWASITPGWECGQVARFLCTHKGKNHKCFVEVRLIGEPTEACSFLSLYQDNQLHDTSDTKCYEGPNEIPCSDRYKKRRQSAPDEWQWIIPVDLKRMSVAKDANGKNYFYFVMSASSVDPSLTGSVRFEIR